MGVTTVVSIVRSRKLTQPKLEHLRKIATASLAGKPQLRRERHDKLGVAPEDLVVACDRALRWDAMEEEEAAERRALYEDAHVRCALAWKKRKRKP